MLKVLYHYPPTGSGNSLKYLEIYNGEFKNDLVFVNWDNITIAGATYKKDVTDYLSKTFELEKVNNSYVVKNYKVHDNQKVKFLNITIYDKPVGLTLGNGLKVKVNVETKDGFYVEKTKVVNKLDNGEIIVTNNEFFMENSFVDIYIVTEECLESNGYLVEISKSLTFSDK